MTLTELGWNQFFDEHFEQFRNRGLVPARVAREDKQIYLVYGEGGELGAEVSGRFRHGAEARADFPAVGDWVAVEPWPEEAKATIHALLPRKSGVSRSEVGGSTSEQIVAANVDAAFLVSGLDDNFNPRRIERYLALAYNSSVQPVVVLNKADVCADNAKRELSIEWHTPRVPPGAQLDEAGCKLIEFAVQCAAERGLHRVRAPYHGFPDETSRIKQLYHEHGFAGECKSEMLSRNLHIDPEPDALQFRSAEEIGLDAFCEAEAACGYGSSAEYSRNDCEFSRKMWSVEPATDWLAAYEAGDPVGTVRVAVARNGVGVLDAIAVAPERRRQGIGRALLARGLSALTGRTDVVWLDVHHDNPAALRLYQRAGFRTHHVHGELIKKLIEE